MTSIGFEEINLYQDNGGQKIFCCLNGLLIEEEKKGALVVLKKIV